MRWGVWETLRAEKQDRRLPTGYLACSRLGSQTHPRKRRHLTCCTARHAGIGAPSCRGLAHVHGVHRGSFHRAGWAEGAREAGGARGLVEHAACWGQGLELGIGQGEGGHLGTHLHCLLLLLQAQLPLLLLLLQPLDGQLPLHLQVFLGGSEHCQGCTPHPTYPRLLLLSKSGNISKYRTYLLLLPHDLQLVCQLDLALPLCFFGCTAKLLTVLLAQGTQSTAGISDLCQLVL